MEKGKLYVHVPQNSNGEDYEDYTQVFLYMGRIKIKGENVGGIYHCMFSVAWGISTFANILARDNIPAFYWKTLPPTLKQ